MFVKVISICQHLLVPKILFTVKHISSVNLTKKNERRQSFSFMYEEFHFSRGMGKLNQLPAIFIEHFYVGLY